MFFDHLGVAAGAAVSLLLAAPVRAEEPPIALEWSAPEGCPAREDVLARVVAAVGANHAQSANARAVVRGVVTRSRDSALLRLDTRVTRAPRSGDSSGVLAGTREIEGATCDEVTAAGVLVIALAIDPDAALRGEGAGTDESSAVPSAQPAAPAGAPPEAVAPGPPTAPSDEPRTRISAVGTALLDVGTLPGPAFGFRAGAGFALARFRVEVGAGYLLPRFAPADEASSALGAFVSLLTGNVRGCYVFSSGRVGAEGCLTTELGALIATGEGFDRTTTVTSPWFSLEPSTGLIFALARDLSLGASVGALVPFGRSSVRFATSTEDSRTYTELHEPSFIAFRLGLSLSLLFH